MKKIISILSLSVVLLTACTTSQQSDVTQLSGFINSDAELFYDFGDVNIEGGLIDHSFTFTNEGEEELVIMNLSTSCMCTSAEVVLADGIKSPLFGMRDTTQWNQSIPAGESFEVVVTYDPMAHGPNATGEINRSVIITTSSMENGRMAVLDPESGYAFTQINIKGMVLSAEEYLESNLDTDEL